MESDALCVLYEDNHLLAINKPAPLPTMGVPADKVSLVDLAKAYLKKKYNKPGNVYLGVVSRLDAPVTGIVLFAKTSKAASRLCDQFRERSVQKKYWALIEKSIDPPQGELQNWLRRHERHRKVLIASPRNPDAQEARLRYTTVANLKSRSLLEIELITGRKHQIRVQLAAVERPIVGDRKYGSPAKFPAGIALHSRALMLEHPVQKTELALQAPLPSYWPRQVIQQGEQ
ncbi:MAG: RNA pseudouridine synthase [Planctomycetaceae bacterium]|nr:RNA pseudouridine synthase [Planctomycetaceae bacterium]